MPMYDSVIDNGGSTRTKPDDTLTCPKTPEFQRSSTRVKYGDLFRILKKKAFQGYRKNELDEAKNNVYQ